MPKPLTNADIGARVKERRVAAGMTQGDLGAAVEVSFQTVAGYESGDIGMSALVVSKIATVLGCATTDLYPPDAPRRSIRARKAEPVKRRPGRPVGS